MMAISGSETQLQWAQLQRPLNAPIASMCSTMRAAIGARRELGLRARLEQMAVHAGVEALRHLLAGDEQRVGAAHRIGRRRKHADAPRGAVEFFDRRAHEIEAFLRGPRLQRVAGRERGAQFVRHALRRRHDVGIFAVEDAQRHHGAHAAVRVCLHHRRDVVEAKALLGKMIDHRRGAGLQHLQAADHRAEVDLLRRAVRGVDLVLPHEHLVVHAVGGAGRKLHRRMPMRIDETGRRQAILRVDGPRRGRRREIRSDRRDAAGLDQDVGRSGAVQDARVADQQVCDGSFMRNSLASGASLSKTCASMPTWASARYAWNDARDTARDALHRRAFMLALAACGAPIATARAAERIRTVGMLLSLPLNDLQWTRLPALQRSLGEARLDRGPQRCATRCAPAMAVRRRAAAAAKELVALRPDVIIASSTPDTAALLAVTRTIPIVFATAADPVGSGFVESLARPGGNVTGFTNSQAEMGGKWLQFLKEIDPRHRPASACCSIPQAVPRAGRYFLEPIEQAAPTFGVTVTLVPIADPARDRRRDRGVTRATPRRADPAAGQLHGRASARDRGGGGAPSRAGHLSAALFHRCGRAHVLWRRAGGARRPNMSISSCAARSPATCRCSRRASTSC